MQVTCSNCQETTFVESTRAGITFTCAHCGSELVVSSHDADPSSSAITASRPESIPQLPSDEQGITSEPTAQARPQLREGDPQPVRVFGRFAVQPYRAEGGMNAAGVVLVLLLEVAAGLVLGVIASLVSRFFYLIILFPVLIGLGTGSAGAIGVRRGKVRNVPVTALIGILGGCVAMFAIHFCDYLEVRSEVPEEVLQQVNFSFLDYIDTSAQQGVTINRAASSGKGINLGYVGSYIYYGVEVLIVAVVSLLIVTTAANRPYCQHCNNWKKRHYLGHLDNPPEHAAASVRDGELQALQPSLGTSSFTRLFVHVCPNCRTEGTVDVLVQKVTKNDKNEEQTQDLAYVSYPPEALAALQHLYPQADFSQGALG